jgi:hypothetical protein
MRRRSVLAAGAAGAAALLALVGHLRPNVAENLDIADEALDGTKFRERVAPVYLRRNQENVLSELPGPVGDPGVGGAEGAAMRAYRQAVLAGNFMAMRRAAFDPGTLKGSAKLRRLVEIVSQAADGGRKVIVFSYFRDVLDTVVEVLAGRDGVPGLPIVGPLTGASEKPVGGPWRPLLVFPEAVPENEEVVPVNVSTWVLLSGVMVGR